MPDGVRSGTISYAKSSGQWSVKAKPRFVLTDHRPLTTVHCLLSGVERSSAAALRHINSCGMRADEESV